MGVRYQIVTESGIDRVIEIHKIVVHRFRLADVDDPDIYAAQPIYEWQQSEAGKYIMQNALSQPTILNQLSHNTLHMDYAIVAELEKKKLSEFYLRFGQSKIK